MFRSFKLLCRSVLQGEGLLSLGSGGMKSGWGLREDLNAEGQQLVLAGDRQVYPLCLEVPVCHLLSFPILYLSNCSITVVPLPLCRQYCSLSGKFTIFQDPTSVVLPQKS